jgi:hypothetical protein
MIISESYIYLQAGTVASQPRIHALRGRQSIEGSGACEFQ